MGSGISNGSRDLERNSERACSKSPKSELVLKAKVQSFPVLGSCFPSQTHTDVYVSLILLTSSHVDQYLTHGELLQGYSLGLEVALVHKDDLSPAQIQNLIKAAQALKERKERLFSTSMNGKSLRPVIVGKREDGSEDTTGEDSSDWSHPLGKRAFSRKSTGSLKDVYAAWREDEKIS
jgi:hypothetical protein